jgi:hypothetical protein
MDQELLEWIREEIRSILHEEMVQSRSGEEREEQEISQEMPKPLRKFKFGEELPNHFDETVYLQALKKNKKKGKGKTIKQINKFTPKK